MVCDNDVIVDLHIHSTASDGTIAPTEILKLALKNRLGAISITDHDAVDGVRVLLQAGIPDEIGFLTGIEISSSPPAKCPYQGSFHILGYGFDIENVSLNRALSELQKARNDRNPRIVEKLKALGIDVELDDIVEHAGDCRLGRPHIARYLTCKGYVSTIDEAFDKYLGKGKPGYVEKFRISCRQAIGLIAGAGGLPVLAHPYLLNLGVGKELENLIVELKTMGLKGIEIYYPEHPPEFVEIYAGLAAKHGLIVTGGTDFHGEIKPEIKLGVGFGNLSVPIEVYTNIVNYLNQGLHERVR